MRIAVCGLMGLLLLASAVQADWPRWRGPSGTGVAPAGEYPTKFGPGDHQQWSVTLPGVGSSTPVVIGQSIFLTATEQEQNVVCAYDLQGNQRWVKQLGPASGAKHRSATGANPTVAADAHHVVAYFKSGQLVCLDHQGELLWSHNLQADFGANQLWWDLGTSPVLSSCGVVVAVMQQGDKSSYLVTFDLQTGEVVWRTPRNFDSPGESNDAYTTPVVVDVNGVETIVSWGADHLAGHDAQTGKQLWFCGDFNPGSAGNWRTIASTVVHQEVAYVPYGRGEFLAAIKLGPQGDLTGEDNLLWRKERQGADVPTPILHNNHLYVLRDRGEVTCLNAQSGEQVWSTALPRSRNKYFGSPLLAGDHLYCVREDGLVMVVSLSGEVVAENDLEEESVAAPTPLDGSLLFRTRTKLYRFR